MPTTSPNGQETDNLKPPRGKRGMSLSFYPSNQSLIQQPTLRFSSTHHCLSALLLFSSTPPAGKGDTKGNWAAVVAVWRDPFTEL